MSIVWAYEARWRCATSSRDVAERLWMPSPRLSVSILSRQREKEERSSVEGKREGAERREMGGEREKGCAGGGGEQQGAGHRAMAATWLCSPPTREGSGWKQ